MSMKARLDRKSGEEDSHAVAAALGHALDRFAPEPEPPAAPPRAETAAPPEPRVAPVLPEDKVPSAVGAAAETGPADPLVATSSVEMSIGAGAAGRQFSYANGVSPAPLVYKAFPAATAEVMFKAFPFSAAGGLWRDIGFAGEYSLTPFTASGYQHLYSTPTSHSFGLCGRLRAAEKPRLLVSACLEYAYTFFGAVGPPARELPDVTYRSVRPAVEMRAAFGAFSVIAAAAFRAVLDAEGTSSRFYGPSGYGLDAEVGGAMVWAPRLEVRALARYEQYSFTFAPPSGATFGAGYSNDQLYDVRASVAIVY